MSLRQPHRQANATFLAALYETLVETDCLGNVLPGLATKWSADPGGTRWTFELRPDATFSDGSPVTAGSVVEAWTDPRLLRGTDARARIRDIQVTGAHVLTVQLDGPVDAAFFADASLVIRRYAEPWPLGTGPYRVSTGSEGRTRGGVHLRRVRDDGPGPLELHFSIPPSGDMRTALDLGADLVITRDAPVVDYARAIDAYSLTVLPWDATYVLLSRASAGAPPVPDHVLEALARDAVQGDARAVRPPEFDLAALPAVDVPERRTGRPRERLENSIVYQRDDAAARGIAERLVALASSADRPEWLGARVQGPVRSAAGLDARAFSDALHAGTAAAYVVSVSKGDIASEVSGLVARSWLRGSTVPYGAITPLVETRPTAIHTRSFGPARIDADGTLRFGLPRERTSR